MRHRVSACVVAGLLALMVAGCKTPPPPAPEGTATPLRVTRLDYVDADAFDALLETTLVNQEPIILIQTDNTKPEWGPRLNAWLAAWNASGRPLRPQARGQSPVGPNVTVDADSIRELRLLIDDLMGRVEESARLGAAWWAESRTRSRRVTLLRPYNLRFDMAEDGRIRLILFHGAYAARYPEFVRQLGREGPGEPGVWEPGYLCSFCPNREH